METVTGAAGVSGTVNSGPTKPSGTWLEAAVVSSPRLSRQRTFARSDFDQQGPLAELIG
jgi:hypothetical protein